MIFATAKNVSVIAIFATPGPLSLLKAVFTALAKARDFA